MSDKPSFEQFFKQFSAALPGALPLQQDLEKNLRIALNSTLGRMNLITREEFDIQSAVLARTRAKLEALEAKVAELETARHAPPTAVAHAKPEA